MRTGRPSVATLALALMASSAFAVEPPAPPDPAAMFNDPTGVVTLGDALSAALVGNPELAVSATEVQVREALALQAGLRPNPEISTEIEDVGGSGERADWDSGQTTISLSQLFELGGKRSKRKRVAELEREAADWDYQSRRLDVAADVGRAFIRTLAAQARLSLAEEFLRVASESARTVSATVRTGAVSPVEASRARAEFGQAKIRQVESETALATARISLATTWGSAEPRFKSARGDLDQLDALVAVDARLAAIDHNPDVARWQTEREQALAELALAKAGRIPDLTVAAGGRHYADSGDGAAVFGFSVPLPLFDRSQGNVLAAERALVRAIDSRRAEVAAVQAAVRTQHAVLLAAARQATELRDEVIPYAEQTYQGAVAAYNRGLFRYLEVLDAQRTLYEVRGQYTDVLEQYHLVAVSLDRLTGMRGTTQTDGEAKESK